ncbi:MAG: hypothetical protein HUK01_10835 [Bacteroidaceae bacterium]|nr:hypothetical protein [Bacteroidaceae bacterium]
MKYVKPELSVFQLRTGRYMEDPIPCGPESQFEPEDEVRAQEMEVVTPSGNWMDGNLIHAGW